MGVEGAIASPSPPNSQPGSLLRGSGYFVLRRFKICKGLLRFKAVRNELMETKKIVTF